MIVVIVLLYLTLAAALEALAATVLLTAMIIGIGCVVVWEFILPISMKQWLREARWLVHLGVWCSAFAAYAYLLSRLGGTEGFVAWWSGRTPGDAAFYLGLCATGATMNWFQVFN